MQKVVLLIILLSTIMNAQQPYDTYNKLWEEVTQLESDDLPKSALKKVAVIFKKAKQVNNATQIVKCLMYQSKYALTLKEDALLDIVHDFEKEIQQADFPTRNILESVLAGLYWQYFQQNRWKFYNRTNTEEKVDINDFRTWDLHTIFKEIHLHYQNSLHNALLAQNRSLKDFNAILLSQDGSQIYRPSLYDFLAHNALKFYRTGESNLAQPSYKFEIENPSLLGDNNTFLQADLSSKDSLSQKLHALKLYKNLSLFHHRNKNTKALIDLTLNRLEFVKSNARFDDVDAVYLQTLLALKQEYKNDEIVTEIDYRIALEYQRLSQDYEAGQNKKHQFMLRDALGICKDAIEKYPNSNGAKKCENLKTNIFRPVLSITNENYIEPDKASRLLVFYKNIDKLYFKIQKVAPNVEDLILKKYNQGKKLDYINSFSTLVSFEANLRDEKDYQQHTTEVVLPKLPQGHYLILASENADFKDDASYAFSFIQATNIALVESNQNKSYRYQVVNRATGKPLEAATVHLRNKNARHSNKPIDKTFTTDKNGFIRFTPKNHHNSIEISVEQNHDKGLFRYFRLFDRNQRERDREFQSKRIFLFTDRSIYRPSQTVYFKGIAVSQFENKSQVIVNKKVELILRDVNYQDIQKLTLITNEFGSFSGEFILPANGLTGQYEISIEAVKDFKDKLSFRRNDGLYGSVAFSVEEYKRPKFSVSFDKIKETFKLNNQVTIKGVATAYAGVTLSNAKAVYRVKRQVQYPKWWYWFRPSWHQSEAQEITHGEVMTNEKGEFEIHFLAQPDKGIAAEDLPIFNYEISVDVTDINGETRSASKVINVGYHTLTANITIDKNIDKVSKKNKLTIDTKNLNGEFIPTKGVLKIYKVVPPNKVYRKPPWNTPDYQNIPKAEFETQFPHDLYKTPEQFSTDTAEPIFKTKFNTEKDKEIQLKNIKRWESGKYIAVVAIKDKFGKNVTEKVKFEVYGAADKKVADKQLFTVKLDKAEYQPNDKIKMRVGSASKDITVIIDIEKNHKVIRTELLHLNDEIKTIVIPVNKEDIGGFAVNYHFVNYNSFQSGSMLIRVPYPKSELEIETLTFRDKLQPGKEETWSFKVKGPKGDKVVAEMLTSMYDASLDQFRVHTWSFQPVYHKYYSTANASNAHNSFANANFRVYQKPLKYTALKHQNYDALNWFGLSLGRFYVDTPIMMEVSDERVNKLRGGKIRSKKALSYAPMDGSGDKAINENIILEEENVIKVEKTTEGSIDFSSVKIRTNFKETAFFFPHLTTDKNGNVSFEFTTPESLTKWKLQLLAHTKDLDAIVESMETVTQKELMVLPNPPRFLREGDRIIISSKISNLTGKILEGMAELQLFDAITNEPIDLDLGNTNQTQGFSINARGNSNVSWSLNIPDHLQAVQYKIVAKSGDYSDGEQNVLAVLSNRMLVTETLPMWVRSHQEKTFSLDKLKNSTSKTLKNHKLTLEVTSNPIWHAVQALPYLMEYPHDCSEQTFARYYANTLASYIANSNPRMQQVFNQWKNSDALISNLEKNQELKSLIINETPWLRDAQSETEQKKRIALLFDLHKMKSEQKRTLRKLKQLQMSNGGFPWFKGNRYANRYITQHIVSGFGHLNKLGVVDPKVNSQEVNDMLEEALKYLDNEIKKDYEKLLERALIIKEKENDKNIGQKIYEEFLAKNNTSHFQVQYLYMRSFFKNKKIQSSVQSAVTYYTEQTYKYWKDFNLYSKGFISLIAHRNNKNTIAEKILASLKENSITGEELGMYWKENTSSWYWYQAPIETQALLIEVFAEVSKDAVTRQKDIDNMKMWLLKNKQTNRWKTTKATTEAVYALLLQGTNWLENTDFVTIKIADQTIKPLELASSKVEAGTGYFKTSWNGSEINKDMADVTISKESEGIAWGALYWQYFEDLDKISVAKTPLQITKKLFLKSNTDSGEQLTEVTAETSLKLGDLIRVRIELKVDRAMEFIHMKDMRASGFEPVNVLSQYKWQDGLGYYESTKDASTNFFIDFLPKGVYVFEYDLRANNAGNFSNGITTIQSMYAPEFSSHSEGVRVQIKN